MPHFKKRYRKYCDTSKSSNSCSSSSSSRSQPLIIRPYVSQIFTNEAFGIIGTSSVLLQPGTSWRWYVKTRILQPSDVKIQSDWNIRLDIAAAAIPNRQVSPRESGIPEVLMEWFRGTTSLTNGRKVIYATDARLPETIWGITPFNKIDYDVEPGFHEYILELTNNCDNCIVNVDHHSISIITFRSRGSSHDQVNP